MVWVQATELTSSIKPGDEVVVNYVDPKGLAEPFSYTIHYWPVEVKAAYCNAIAFISSCMFRFCSVHELSLVDAPLSTKDNSKPAFSIVFVLSGQLEMVADVLREAGFVEVAVQRLELNPNYVDKKGFDLSTFVKHTGNRCLIGRKPLRK